MEWGWSNPGGPKAWFIPAGAPRGPAPIGASILCPASTGALMFYTWAPQAATLKGNPENFNANNQPKVLKKIWKRWNKNQRQQFQIQKSLDGWRRRTRSTRGAQEQGTRWLKQQSPFIEQRQEQLLLLLFKGTKNTQKSGLLWKSIQHPSSSVVPISSKTMKVHTIGSRWRQPPN